MDSVHENLLMSAKKSSWSQMASLTMFALKLSLEELEKVIPKQAFQIGKSLVTCGDVGGISFSTFGEDKSCSGFVHSEKSATK